MAHDIQASSSARKRRWRARKRLEKLEAEKAARAAHRAALDAARVSRGLLPIVEARREKVRKFREKQKLLGEIVKNSWFAPSLTDSEFDQYSEEQGWDSVQARERKASFERAAAIGCAHVNRFILDNYVHAAVDARLKFHTAFLIHGDIRKAWERADAMKIEFKGSTPVARELDRQQKYEDAMIRWKSGDEIAAIILTGKYVPQFDEE